VTPRILVVYSGGTIGMVSSADGYVPAAGFQDRLQSRLASRQSQLPGFDLVELDRLIDSANLVPGDWAGIARVLVSAWEDYDGFVVLHGTDTMAYTASALSYLLAGCNKPVILTGAQIPLGHPRTDALDNIITSLLMAATPAISEVCICFHGRLLRGNRARKLKTAELDAFDSPNLPWLGQAGTGIELRHDLLLPAGCPDFRIPEFQPSAVAVLPLFPGIDGTLAEAMLSRPGLRALILQSYGAGNAPDTNAGLIAAMGQGIAAGITLVNLSQCPYGAVSQGAYATGSALAALGVLPGADLTPEAAFAKLHWLIASGASGQELRNGFMNPRAGDLTLSPS